MYPRDARADLFSSPATRVTRTVNGTGFASSVSAVPVDTSGDGDGEGPDVSPVQAVSPLRTTKQIATAAVRRARGIARGFNGRST